MLNITIVSMASNPVANEIIKIWSMFCQCREKEQFSGTYSQFEEFYQHDEDDEQLMQLMRYVRVLEQHFHKIEF
jgi:hypothetical protein